MSYVARRPVASLRGLVDRLWHIEDSPDAGSAESICPDGRSEIVLNLGDPMAERVGVRHNRQPRHLVVGQMTSPITVVATGRMKMSAARRPLATLFGRIVRFQRAFSALGFECGVAIAARYGFADPAHLVHEIRRLAGQPPTALAEASGLTAFFARSGWRDRYLLQPETRLAPSFALGKARSDLSPEQATRLAPPASRRNAGATRQKAGLRPEGSLASFG